MDTRIEGGVNISISSQFCYIHYIDTDKWFLHDDFSLQNKYYNCYFRKFKKKKKGRIFLN